MGSIYVIKSTFPRKPDLKSNKIFKHAAQLINYWVSLTRWLVGVETISSSSDLELVGDPKFIPVDILVKVLVFLELHKK